MATLASTHFAQELPDEPIRRQRWAQPLAWIVALACCVAGVYGLILRFDQGHAAAAYGSYVPWGLWIAAYVAFIGSSAGAFAFAAVVLMVRQEEYYPVARLAILVALAAFAVGMTNVWLDLGHPLRAWKLLLQTSWTSIMGWMSWFYVLYGLILLLGLVASIRMRDLQAILQTSTARHSHLCPRQILGARIGLAGGAALGLDLPRSDKRLLVIVETDGCFADGVEVATGCTVGHRTLRVEDYGKVAATFIDVKTGVAVRVAPRVDVRERAYAYAPDEPRHYFAQLHAYQIMPDADLLTIQAVTLATPVAAIVSRPGVRVRCDQCGEEIINEREVICGEQRLCRGCAGNAYHVAAEQESYWWQLPVPMVVRQP